MGNRENGSAQNLLLAFIFLGAAIALIYLALGKPEGQSKMSSKAPQPVSASSPTAESVVNKYLKETNRAIEFQQLQAKIQNQFVMPKVGETISPSPQNRNKKTIPVAPGESSSPSVPVYDNNSPAAQIHQDLAEQQRLEEYDRQYREEYIRQFVENARRNGWKLVVDENGVVKSATPINTEPKPRIFDGPSRLSEH